MHWCSAPRYITNSLQRFLLDAGFKPLRTLFVSAFSDDFPTYYGSTKNTEKNNKRGKSLPTTRSENLLAIPIEKEKNSARSSSTAYYTRLPINRAFLCAHSATLGPPPRVRSV